MTGVGVSSLPSRAVLRSRLDCGRRRPCSAAESCRPALDAVESGIELVSAIPAASSCAARRSPLPVE